MRIFFPKPPKNIPNNHQDELVQIKNKLRNSCEKKVIINLMKRNNIAITNQCKGKGVVIIKKIKHRENGLALLPTK